MKNSLVYAVTEIRYDKYDEEYSEIVGIYTTLDKAKDAIINNVFEEGENYKDLIRFDEKDEFSWEVYLKEAKKFELSYYINSYNLNEDYFDEEE